MKNSYLRIYLGVMLVCSSLMGMEGTLPGIVEEFNAAIGQLRQGEDVHLLDAWGPRVPQYLAAVKERVKELDITENPTDTTHPDLLKNLLGEC